jgi:DNA uptake protein ComE-like DNA-binding protein
LALLSTLILLALAGCAQKESSDQLREQTAQATAELKSDAKAVADGVKEGWNRNHPLDLNAASKEELLRLPGITNERADRIIANRPYRESHDVVTRRVLSEAEYHRIEDQVTAK